MKKEIIDKLTNFIINNKSCSEKDIKVYKYGLEALYNLLTKTVVILLLSILLGTIKECIILIFVYTSLRIFSYGLHASSSIGCWLTTIPIYIGGSLFIKFAIIPKHILAISWAIYSIFVVLWAPADTKKRPLIRSERRKKLKIESLIVCFIYYLIITYSNNQILLNTILFAFSLQSICICPLTYKITNNQFNNYLYYKKSLN